MAVVIVGCMHAGVRFVGTRVVSVRSYNAGHEFKAAHSTYPHSKRSRGRAFPSNSSLLNNLCL